MPIRNPYRWHDDVLVALVKSYPEPPVYLEIGVASCECFSKVAPYCLTAHAVDPNADAIANVPTMRRCQPWRMTSDEFFRTYDGHPDVIFIDGLHAYEQAKRDFEHAAQILAPGGAIAIHDVWPGSLADTRPEACGDVWRLVDDIQGDGTSPWAFDGGPGWDTYLYQTFPGLLVCQRHQQMPEWT